MNPEEQIVTWLISLGVLESPKKTICDPEEFLKSSLKNGVVLCKLINRLMPGSVEKFCLDPQTEADCINNINDFLKGCATLQVEIFDPDDLYSGVNFSKVLSTLLAVNKATEDQLSERPCGRSSSLSAANTSQTNPQGAVSSTVSGLQRQSKTVEMTENGSHQLIVKARFNFKQTNEDELSVCKGDIIYVTRVEEGGWWEGTLNGRTGWFPSNYVREIKSSERPLSPKAVKGFETAPLTKNYYTVVLQNILDTEKEYAKELQSLLVTYLRPLQSNNNLSTVEVTSLLGNFEEVCTFQQTLCQALEECSKFPENQHKVGGCLLSLMPHFKSMYLAYCANHPSAVNVLTQHSDELEQFMENQGASSPGILILTTNLSKPFMRLEKYVTLLQELERHMEDTHPDHQDILKAIVAFKTLMGQCQDLRKRKQLELQILSEPIQAWEGEDIKNLGNVIFMSQVMVQYGACEEKEERYLMLFSNVLIMLSASPRMSGFIYQGKIPIAGTVVTRLDEIEGNDCTFEITGNTVERIVVHCNNNQDFQEWLEQLNRLIRGPASCSSLSKTSSSSCSAHSSFSSTGQPRGPLEPPQIIKPWSLSCLRPAPPLRPSAALGYKERMSYILKESSKSPKTMKKFLHKRKTERKPSEEEYVIRKSTAALEEDAQILKVIEAYCTSANFQQGHGSSTRKDSIPQVLLPEEEKLIIEETRSNGQTIMEEKSLVDTVYALKDEVRELKQENKRMKQCLEEELKSRRDLEKLVRRLLKQTDECIRGESSSKTSILP
ncbi:Rac/Cdc42 guanine nucleotide exchange factor 6 [Homo sapiens]|uniref:Rho guanine nucleotide exchange factor 6 n=2 Tax=Homo sapiens TaxID=9606 RepID=ARHG6_HUMAN|nr:rho guanine nucleotide exchange factor 6 isoform 1 [Homo sapiens]Q15052.2 RecName: Full=Rho guanine nucleotide exchange factor 6; AltName: Full=Alpha-Pix; AltName: Full=COOL-2; AltName: Full=PAK-interacting exchange factor alpha; AltName: Full=Rac/Cdc42 guanine nucleotide exchange factor 6 [Homo sapiens]AAH39856.1 Rac/Cdc42 guanine nucleotide exchange factor (GEF) 6 [Homo sapiens]EAW88460.1 Rac/Cdc42 guanine nucleotide exchange factor (GEF) 6, isoform CRA_a [Homo sapiens]KAI2600956.1 Rac/Cdc|eukprot:NP_004831.1 rho guanine nucleotide exchange factor 6 isoform 1 [Homo sapiens]